MWKLKVLRIKSAASKTKGAECKNPFIMICYANLYQDYLLRPLY